MEVALLDAPNGNVVARGSYLGGPDYEFVIKDDRHIDPYRRLKPPVQAARKHEAQPQ